MDVFNDDFKAKLSDKPSNSYLKEVHTALAEKIFIVNRDLSEQLNSAEERLCVKDKELEGFDDIVSQFRAEIGSKLDQ